MKGVYTIFLLLEDDTRIKVGALGEIFFEQGVYVYTGSAMNSLESRVSRHFSDEKSTHWHIDYLTEEAEVFAFAAFATDSEMECVMASAAETSCEPVQDFGCSDCGCDSHLFRIGSKDSIPETVLTSRDTS
jgi:Uri superfamily endonuclease